MGHIAGAQGGVDGMWKLPKGAISSSWSTRKKRVSILNCFKEIEFGIGDGTMEIPRVTSVSQCLTGHP